MELSEALLSGKVKFKIRVPDPDNPARKEYMPFQGCVEDAFPLSRADRFPLAFCCPLFVGASDPEPKVILDLIPTEAARDMAAAGCTICFLCDVIDCLSVAHGWDEKRVGEWIQTVERAMDREGLDRRGHPIIGKRGRKW